MYDTSKAIFRFYDEAVRLLKDAQDEMRKRRNANEDRLSVRLKNEEQAMPQRFVQQGSYAMRTMVQHKENDYDIDDGVVFAHDDLKGPRGGYMSAADAKQMVCDALQDARLSEAPEVRTNCVRIYYPAGYHIDMPVYRAFYDEDGNEDYFELASTDWKKSDPEAVTEWFNNAVKEKSPDANNGCQMRRVTCLLKAWARSRASWNMPCGFILSILVHECYVACADRDDEALYKTMKAIYDRLDWYNMEVYHPITNEKLTNGSFLTDDAKMVVLHDQLDVTITTLKEVLLDEEDDCTRKAALKAWKKVFAHEYFDELLAEDEAAKAVAPAVIAAREPSHPVIKAGGGRYG